MSQWLNAEALAQYIMGAISMAVVILGWWLFKRKRAHYVRIEELSGLSLISIDPAFRERITVVLDKETGGEEQIDTLSQMRVKIHNATRETIENVALQFLFEPTGARFLQLELDPPEDMQWQKDFPYYQVESESRIRVSLPYLKSSEVYGEGQAATLTVLADGHPRIAKVVGGGRDWTAQYISAEERLEQGRRWFSLAAIAIPALTFITLIISIWAFSAYLSPRISLRPGLLIVGVIIGFIDAGVVGAVSQRILWHLGKVIQIR